MSRIVVTPDIRAKINQMRDEARKHDETFTLEIEPRPIPVRFQIEERFNLENPQYTAKTRSFKYQNYWYEITPNW